MPPETATEPAVKRESPDYRSAIFSAKAIPAIGELLKELPRNCFGDDGYMRTIGTIHEAITVAPVASGGVDIIASHPWAMVVVHDPSGKANKPIRFHADDAMIAACRPLYVKRPFDCNGDDIEAELPGWMVPGNVVITTENDQRPNSANTVSPRPDGMSLIYVEPLSLPDDADEDLGGVLYKSSFPQLHKTQTVKHSSTVDYAAMMDATDFVSVAALRLSSWAYRLIALFGDDPVLRFRESNGAVLVTYMDEPHARLLVMPRCPDETITK